MDFNVPYYIPLHCPEFDLHDPFAVPFDFPCVDPVWPVDPAIVSFVPTVSSIHKIKKRKASHSNDSLAQKHPKRKHTTPARRASVQPSTNARGRPQPQQQTSIPEDMATVTGIEEDLQHLQDEWASIEIVFNSIRNAFPVHSLDNAPEELLDEVDRELSIAYDDLKAQVRHLTRSLHRLESEIAPFRPLRKIEPTVSPQQQPPQTPSSPH